MVSHIACVSGRTFTAWCHTDIFSDYAASHELQWQECKLVLLHHTGRGAVQFCSLKKSILIFKRFLSSQTRVVYFCELGQRGSSNLDRIFLWWTGYEAAIWVSPNSVKNNHRLLLSLLLLFRLSFIPSNDRRPSSCLSSFFVLLASSAKLRLEEGR